MGLNRTSGATRRGGYRLAMLCMAVLALCVAHQALMLTERHAVVMGAQHERGMVAPQPLPTSGMGERVADSGANRPVPSPSQPLMGDCPAQQAVIPLLLFLALLLGMLRRGEQDQPAQSRRRWCPLPDAIPPLLPPGQRRALLQVFTI